MMIDIWILIAAGLVTFVSLWTGARANKRCSKLKQEVDQLQRYSFRHADVIESLEKRVKSLEEDIEKVKGEHQVHITNISKILAEYDLKTENFNRSVEKRMKELYDIVQRYNEKADKEELADIVDPENDDTNSDEVPVYRWVFPAEEPDHEKQLINGQLYTVVGVLKNPGANGLVTCEAFWNGHEFVLAINDKFDTVYAYIRKPESADVMEKVVQMALANKG
jgi:TolA-binding protein